jgi:hypothetical protein
MGWETRHGKLYYYCKERGADGRVRSIYVGAGERGRQAALEDERASETHRARRLAALARPAVEQPITAREIVERALSRWPSALHESRASSLNSLLERGMLNVALRSAGISEVEAERRGVVLHAVCGEK